MELKDYIAKNGVFFVEKTDKVSVITELAAKSLTLGKVADPDEFYAALMERETLMSTGIGLGVAIPHAKLSSIRDFFVTVGVLRQPVEWDALDRKPVGLVFLIGGPDASQGAYLQILAQIMLVIKNDARLMKLKAATSAEEIIAALAGGAG